jgi:arylsulfatase A-like enzyme
MQVLKKQGVDNNTMVIYMTDNGRPFPRAKTRLYDSGIKTPFIVRWPAKIQKGRTDALISSIDIAPTLCELAETALPETFQGVSFVPVLYNPLATVREYIAGEHNWHDYQAFERAIRNKQYLYIRNSFPEFNASPPADAVGSLTYQEMIKMYKNGELTDNQIDCFVSPRPEEELYDVVLDPYQFHNLAENPDCEATMEKMRNMLDEWIIQFNDTITEIPTPDKFDRWTGKRLTD